MTKMNKNWKNEKYIAQEMVINEDLTSFETLLSENIELNSEGLDGIIFMAEEENEFESLDNHIGIINEQIHPEEKNVDLLTVDEYITDGVSEELNKIIQKDNIEHSPGYEEMYSQMKDTAVQMNEFEINTDNRKNIELYNECFFIFALRESINGSERYLREFGANDIEFTLKNPKQVKKDLVSMIELFEDNLKINIIYLFKKTLELCLNIVVNKKYLKIKEKIFKKVLKKYYYLNITDEDLEALDINVNGNELNGIDANLNWDYISKKLIFNSIIIDGTEIQRKSDKKWIVKNKKVRKTFYFKKNKSYKLSKITQKIAN